MFQTEAYLYNRKLQSQTFIVQATGGAGGKTVYKLWTYSHLNKTRVNKITAVINECS
jgi:hypothetical protein